MEGYGLQGNDKATRVVKGTQRLDTTKGNQQLFPSNLVIVWFETVCIAEDGVCG